MGNRQLIDDILLGDMNNYSHINKKKFHSALSYCIVLQSTNTKLVMNLCQTICR